MKFSDVPVRTYAVVDPSWWNVLRDAGLTLEGILVPISTPILNTQAAPVNVAGVAVDSAVYTSVKYVAEVRQKTATAELICLANITLLWRALTATWDVLFDFEGDDPGLVLSVSTAGTVGQLQYTSGTLAGSGYVGAFKYVATKFGV